jgi:septum formation protein
MLEDAGLDVTTIRPDLDENAAKADLRARGLGPAEQALALAERKALSVAQPGFIIGADQMLALGEVAFDKPHDLPEARCHLQRLRGRTHELATAAAVARDGAIIWRYIDTPKLTMRAFSDAFLDNYLSSVGGRVLNSVGAYHLEGLGAQLFERVEGDYFSVLGLPLLPLLAFLREQGIVRA